jgi:hypothetical protein
MKIFVLNVGRSGSRSVATAYGFEHEPDGEQPSPAGVYQRAKGRLIYGETSHWWKDRIPMLLSAYPGARLFHLVRNGKDVTRSFLARDYYTGKPASSAARECLPPHTPEMSQFERICWYWRYWNEEIEKHTSDRVRVEDLNVPRLHKTDKLPEWNPGHEEVFEHICGQLNRRYGY